MEKLGFQDAAFLRLETPQKPFHVSGLMILKPPANAPDTYLRKLATKCGRLNELWPVFNQQLADPDASSGFAWVAAHDYNPARHLRHYRLPQPGRLADLMTLVSAAHEQPLDRSRPLWEIHLIEGLPDGRFALFCKVHHALVDGVGALRMINTLFSPSDTRRLRFSRQAAHPHHHHHGLRETVGKQIRAVLQQSRAMPQLTSLLNHMGRDGLLRRPDAQALPFTAPRTLFNTALDSSRRAITCDLPLSSVRRIGKASGGTINDVLLAICGGALRSYLRSQNALPAQSLVAGLPVSVKSAGEESGNALSFILCPFFTNDASPERRLQRIVKVTRHAKEELARVSPTASQDMANLLLMPVILLTLSGNATRMPPEINAIFSNVPGSRERLYLEGAELEGLYPLSVIMDGMGLNLTVISYGNKLCFALTTCPGKQPQVEQLGSHLKRAYRDLRNSVLG